MTDAPERIWAWENHDGLGSSRGWNLQTSFNAQEYIRADLSPSPEVVKELVEALRWYSGDPSSQGDVARDALAKLEGGE